MQKIHSHIACEQRVMHFYYAFDRGDLIATAEHLAPACTWQHGGVTLRSRQQILESFSKRSATQVVRHIVSNFTLLGGDTENATVAYCLTVHLFDNGQPPCLPVPGSTPFILVDVTCKLACNARGEWLIERKEIRPIFSHSVDVVSPLHANESR
ncbi:hypothetical protein J8I32_16755 [Cupriavidus sp. AcVe19-1a]|nr:hypothetical protein [Cupriavidus sp. AcVe19-1a]